MRGKIMFVTGVALGYVLGARAGRERYLEIKRGWSKFWNDPRVQDQVKQAETFVKEKAPEVVDFVSDSAKKVAGQARKVARKTENAAGSSSSTSSTSTKPSFDNPSL